jgi:TRAP-type mannitol/chloroaromatic compound transport system permease large subunit
MHHLDTAATGAIGFTAPLAAAAISLDPALDLELRVTSMVIGILVGLASFAKLAYDIYADHRARNKK